MSDFLSLVMPHWKEGSQFIQLTARKDGQIQDAHFCADRATLETTKNTWVANKWDVYFTTVVYTDLDRARENWRFARVIHKYIDRKFVALDFDIKDQPPKFQNKNDIVNAVSVEMGTPNIVVDSGNGVHLYYILTGHAKVLGYQVAALQRFRHDGDPSVPVIDKRAMRAATDILRLPGSYNQKSGTEVTYQHNTHTSAYKSLPLTVPTGISKSVPAAFLGAVLCGNYRQDPVRMVEEVKFSDVYKACAAVRMFVGVSQKGFQHNGQVYGTQQDVVTFSSVGQFSLDSQGREARSTVQNVMLNFPGAQQGYLDTQYDSVRYPRGCDNWSDPFRAKCLECEFLKYHRSEARPGTPTPIGAGRYYARQQAAIAEAKQLHADEGEAQTEDTAGTDTIDNGDWIDVPAPFYVTSRGLYRSSGKPDDPPLPVCGAGFKMLTGRTAESPVKVRILLNNTETKDVLIKGSINTQLEELAKHGLTVMVEGANQAKRARDALYQCFNLMVQQTVPVVSKLGWTTFNNGLAFSLPECTYYLDTTQQLMRAPPPIVSKVKSAVSEPEADADEWWRVVRPLYFSLSCMKERSEVILMSFASILYERFSVESGTAGHCLVLTGPPNCGKSQALYTAAQVWGKADFSNSKSDTFAYVNNQMAVTSNIPLTFDDMMRGGFSLTPEQVAQLLHMVTEGVGRGRSRQTGEGNLDRDEFSLCLLATANASITAKISKAATSDDELQAATQRVTEYPCYDVLAEGLRHGVDLLALSKQARRVSVANGGAAGREFIKYIMPRLVKLTVEYQTLHAQLQTVDRNRHNAARMAMIEITKRILTRMGRLPKAAVRADVVAAVQQEVAERREHQDMLLAKDIPNITEMVMMLKLPTIPVLRNIQTGRYEIDEARVNVYDDSLKRAVQSSQGIFIWHEQGMLTIEQAKQGIAPPNRYFMNANSPAMHYVLGRRTSRDPNDIIKHWIESKSVAQHETFSLPLPHKSGLRHTGKILTWTQ